jgi:hypothetical protein
MRLKLQYLLSVFLCSPVIFSVSPSAIAQSAGCGSGWSNTALKYLSPVGSRQFRVACDEHDVCYDTFGKSRQECDKAFHNRMLGICARNHNTIIGRPLKVACNGRADAYYTGVLEGGKDKYNKAQANALAKAQESASNTCRNNNIEIRPTTGNIEFRRGQEWNTCSNYKFIFQNDGNLVLYNPTGSPIFATGTNNRADLLAVQADGNIVLYGSSGVVWSTGTGGVPGAFLSIQWDGNIVVYGRNDSPLWSSNTFGR